MRDHGIGIDPERPSTRIFERFERAVSSRYYGGLGLGLYITRQIVEAHGGTIRVSSEVGVGSQFTVEIPFEPQPGAEREPNAEPGTSNGMEQKHTQSRAVLLVEDDPDIREAIGDVLAEEGYDVSVADTGLTALDRLQRAPLPDVILLDLMMPVMDGWQFRARQSQHPEWKAIPVIVLSAVGNTQEKAASIGASGCLRKPLDIDELLDMIERVMPRHPDRVPA